MEIRLKSDNATYLKNVDKHEINFGSLSLNANAAAELELKGKNLSNFSAKATCSCTTSNVKVIDENTISITAKYKNTDQKGSFSKTLILNYTENGMPKRDEVKLKGVVA